MSLTKADLAKSILENVHLKRRKKERQQFLFPELNYDVFTKKRAAKLVDATFEIIKKNLEKGENVLISGFGRFQVKFKWARKGRNPQTGEQIILNSRRIVSFHCSPKLRDKINKRSGQ